MTKSFVVTPPDASFGELPDAQGYLERMAKPLQEKLRMGFLIPPGAKTVLDAGCADGTVTIAMAEMFPHIQFLGIDLDENFIEIARERSKHLKNVRFQCVYLRQLLLRKKRYDCVQFCSVLHEFFQYGEGISSVLKALADAHELLNEGGVINIRDMFLDRVSTESDLRVAGMRSKILARCDQQQVRDFTDTFGAFESLYTLNHFLLKYMYTDNWKRECAEHYVGVFAEEILEMLALLGMRHQYRRSYTIPFLEEKWTTDFGFTAEEIAALRSTTIISARKEPKRIRGVR